MFWELKILECLHMGIISPVFGDAWVWPAFYLSSSASSSSCWAVSSSLKDMFSWHGLAYLKLLLEGSVAFSYINLINGNFSFLTVPYTFPPFEGPWKKLWPVCICGDMTDYLLDGSYSHSSLFWKTCYGMPGLKTFGISDKGSWSGI